MSNTAVRRFSGAARSRLLKVAGRAAPGLLAFALLAPGRLAAQVGHEPARSPFHDITTRQSIFFGPGWFFGNPSETGAGAKAGPTFTFRLETRLSGPVDLLATVALIESKRDILNPYRPPATRLAGEITNTMYSADLGLGLNLTGAKSWRGLAPYVAAGIGIIIPSHPAIDTGGYVAKSNFTFVPTLGMRYMFGSSFALQFEARDNTIRYEWPLAYFRPTDASGNVLPITPVLDPAKFDNRDMTHNYSLSASLVYRFNF